MSLKEAFPVFDQSDSKEMLHDVLSEPPWCSLEPFPYVLPLYPREKSSSPPSVPMSIPQETLKSNGFTPQLSLLQTRQSQRPQPLHAGHAFQPFHLMPHFANYGCFSHNDSALRRFEFSMLWVLSTSFYFLRCHLKITVQSALITLTIVPQP